MTPPGHLATPVDLAAIVIGRNEAARLAKALDSVKALGLPCVYVDSGSVDDSVAIATAHADQVHPLDPALPFSAARARNEGRACLHRLAPQARFALFLDGDCVLLPQFPSRACAAFAADPRLAIVTGHLREHAPEASVYNRLCALEWGRDAGEITNFDAVGGIMIVRLSAFDHVQGFNPRMIAGEDPDFAIRVALDGGRVCKLDVPMAIHDADIHRFDQWWRRAVRAGHALAHRHARHGRSPLRDSRRQWLSTLFWGLGLPAFILAALWPSRGLSLILLGGYLALGWRIFRHYRRSGWSLNDARLGAGFGLLSKFANGWGIVHYVRDRVRGRFELIEYK